MLIVVSYDVSTTTAAGRRRLRRIAKACQNHGQRVQYSVFECHLDPAQWRELRHRLLQMFEPADDSLRFYFLGSNWRGDVEHHGAKAARDPDDPLMV